jgi:biopolymer transport protein ExbD
MVGQLEKSEKAQQDDRIAIKASGQVAYGKVIRVMSAAREAGIGSVGLASDRI